MISICSHWHNLVIGKESCEIVYMLQNYLKNLLIIVICMPSFMFCRHPTAWGHCIPASEKIMKNKKHKQSVKFMTSDKISMQFDVQLNTAFLTQIRNHLIAVSIIISFLICSLIETINISIINWNLPIFNRSLFLTKIPVIISFSHIIIINVYFEMTTKHWMSDSRWIIQFCTVRWIDAWVNNQISSSYWCE